MGCCSYDRTVDTSANPANLAYNAYNAAYRILLRILLMILLRIPDLLILGLLILLTVGNLFSFLHSLVHT